MAVKENQDRNKVVDQIFVNRKENTRSKLFVTHPLYGTSLFIVALRFYYIRVVATFLQWKTFSS